MSLDCFLPNASRLAFGCMFLSKAATDFEIFRGLRRLWEKIRSHEERHVKK